MRCALYVAVLTAALLAAPATGLSQSPPTDAMQQELVRSERDLLDAIRSGDADRLHDLIADSALIISAGQRLKATGYDQFLPNLSVQESSLEDFRIVPLGENAGIVNCRIRFAATYNKKSVGGTYYVSSGWERRGDRWVLVFHQDMQAKR